MRPAARVLFGSLAINAVLLVAFASKPALLPAAARDFIARVSPSVAGPVAHNVRVSPADTSENDVANFWRSLDSKDLPTFVRHLRAAGFSEAMALDAEPDLLADRRVQRLSALTEEAKAKITASLGGDRGFQAYQRYGGGWLRELQPDIRQPASAKP